MPPAPPLSDALHVITTATTSAATPFSKSQFPTKPTNLPRPKTLTLSPSLSSSNTSIGIDLFAPPKVPKLPQSELTFLPSSPPPYSDFLDKMLFLDSLGIDLFALAETHPPLLSAAAADVKSLISFLRSAAGLSSADLRRIAAMCPDILSLKTTSVVPVFTFLLREAGVPANSLRHVIHRRPRLLACDVKTRLRPTLYFLQGTIGISEINRHTYLLSCSVENKFVPRIEYFRKMGLSEMDTRTIFCRFPPLFCYSIGKNFEPKFDYFMVEMGRNLKELVEFPQYFSFSLENRIKPRHRKCVEKGVFLSLPLMLKSSDQRFLDRLEVCCNSSLPTLVYVKVARVKSTCDLFSCVAGDAFRLTVFDQSEIWAKSCSLCLGNVIVAFRYTY